MKNFKKLVAAATIIGIVGVVGVAGASYTTGSTSPASIVAGLTGQSVDQVMAARAAGKTYGAIAKDVRKLDEFKAENFEQKKAALDQRVKDGYLTQEQADTLYNSMKANQATCDATGTATTGQGKGLGFGQGQGMGAGAGQRNGSGMSRAMKTRNLSN
ncbi:hypothetical protein [Desulfosporosinus sp. Sb-LF]|uniref:hypothetical protein n=1 Tax=Desulfosporosinus sp. Sb-LF TaxID=2560027 RepID=UPI00107F88DA|nr:hypothetical protein [Desulfosporosinus sp. Sb-LF]TGE33449.1 hypothetical protein E4K68_08165 [Desulfosporosinus sp. Sb-LF]